MINDRVSRRVRKKFGSEGLPHPLVKNVQIESTHDIDVSLSRCKPFLGSGWLFVSLFLRLFIFPFPQLDPPDPLAGLPDPLAGLLTLQLASQTL